MDGLETARRMRELVGPETLVIIMSAYDWAQIESEARAAGVDHFISKPMFPESVRDALSGPCRTHRPHRSRIPTNFAGNGYC